MSDWFDDGGAKDAVDVVTLLSPSTIEYVSAIVSHGALVSIGRTSDGGALGVTVTLDGRWKREYFRLEAELVDWLKDAEDAVGTAAADVAASSARRKRSRRSRDT